MEQNLLKRRLKSQNEECSDTDDGDIWDDSALIKAYDDAVAIMKARLAEREGGESTGNVDESTSLTNAQGAAKKKKKRHKPKKKRQSKWKVGDACRAVFSEDGVLYDAEIIQIDDSAATCTVRYLHYENEEDQALSELIPPKGRHNQTARVSVSESDSNDVPMQSPTAARSNRAKMSSAAEAEQTTQYPKFNGGFAFPGMPFQAYGFPGTYPAQMSAPPQMPPPPPPPPLVTEDFVSDDEALSSMLMSWYMSGYQTGYYQGLQQARRQQPGGPAR